MVYLFFSRLVKKSPVVSGTLSGKGDSVQRYRSGKKMLR